MMMMILSTQMHDYAMGLSVLPKCEGVFCIPERRRLWLWFDNAIAMNEQ